MMMMMMNDLHIRTRPIVPGDILDMQIRTFHVKVFESYRLTDRQTDGQDRHKS